MSIASGATGCGTSQSPAAPGSSNPASLPLESTLDSGLIERLRSSGSNLSRWMGWRLRLLFVAALLGCLGILLLARWLAEPHYLDAVWRAVPSGQLELTSTANEALKPLVGRMLVRIEGRDGTVAMPDGLLLRRSQRWLVDDETRQKHLQMQRDVAAVLSQPQVTLQFDDGRSVLLAPQPRGLDRLPSMFWFLSLFSLALYLVAMVVVLAGPSGRNLLYAVMSVCQAGNLLVIGVESTSSLGLPMWFVPLNHPLRMALELTVAAAVVNATCLHPRRLPGSGWIALGGWLVGIGFLGLAMRGLPHTWWWMQSLMAFYGLCGIALLTWSHQIEPHPFAIVLRRFGVLAVVGWVLLTTLVAITLPQPLLHSAVAAVGPMIWHVFFASLLLLVPFLSRSQLLMREFALLGTVSTIATALDLLFVAVFSLGQFASLTLALFVSLAVYAGVRQWAIDRLLGRSVLTTERMFENLYRIAREVEAKPERTLALLSQLLQELFDPMELTVVDKRSNAARVVADGSTLLLPVPRLGADADAAPAHSIVMRFAHRGRHLFTIDDAQLADRIVEQLQRAVAFDRAVEQGRSEERARLAQDLHDDIGARLLTLMYQAQTPEMESYIRHTLQDLKTLTRGLATPTHRLSDAAGEWKADITQRLKVAHVELDWRFFFDDDVMLSVVQWSALTRVLRELVSNVISHAQARRVEIDFQLHQDRLSLRVSDDGTGGNPSTWAHGLGLGGVRKRVKQLGGEVRWHELQPRGIRCEVSVAALSRCTVPAAPAVPSAPPP